MHPEVNRWECYAGRVKWFSAVVGLAVMGACASRPTPCASLVGCPRGEECLAHRCVRAGGEPVRTHTERHVLNAVAIVVLDPSVAGESGHPARHDPLASSLGAELRSVVTLGSRAQGKTLLLLRFSSEWDVTRRVESAFLVLEPVPGTVPGLRDIPVEVWRIQAPWTPERVSWLHQPALGYPMSRGLARTAPPTVLRIDVTPWVRTITSAGRTDYGLAVTSAAGESHGATFATGATGSMPRLELYLSSATGQVSPRRAARSE
jgi:hypothetical protein